MQEVFSRSLNNIAGLTGSYFVGNTSANTGSWYAFVVNTNDVVSDVLDQEGNSIKTKMGLGSNPTLTAGILFTVPMGTYISSITLASGSIVLYSV
jgi:hypothetical protein